MEIVVILTMMVSETSLTTLFALPGVDRSIEVASKQKEEEEEERTKRRQIGNWNI